MPAISAESVTVPWLYGRITDLVLFSQPHMPPLRCTPHARSETLAACIAHYVHRAICHVEFIATTPYMPHTEGEREISILQLRLAYTRACSCCAMRNKASSFVVHYAMTSTSSRPLCHPY